ncbi:hypothetical protein [Shewanella sp. GD03713]|uniref:hypothetical protein n=1 Tax=Shewanella sp. GD03713 TaxID=2975372 RepID=UPI00244B1CB8|nr:hypothetical protein [Shewanella sp. GD03713]MDH1470236.1 hypothetical protein [Shewanella sp. GD03713]
MKSKKMELWGLILILLSSFTQLFILNKSQDLTNNAVVWKIENKMDVIFSVLTSNHDILNFGVPENPKTAGELFTNYKYAEMNKSMETTQNQTKFIGLFVSVLFVLGSFLLVLAKYIELKKI